MLASVPIIAETSPAPDASFARAAMDISITEST